MTGRVTSRLRFPDRLWVLLEQRRAAAFTVAGIALLASLIVPVTLSLAIEGAWVVGLILVGFGVIALVAGSLGIYPGVSDRASIPAISGLLGTAVAGTGALVMLGLAGIALLDQPILGGTAGKPMGVFIASALVMAGGLTVSYLGFGLTGWRDDHPSRKTGRLLMLAGIVLLVPTIAELLRIVVGVETPSWLFLPAFALVSIDALVVGYTLRPAE